MLIKVPLHPQSLTKATPLTQWPFSKAATWLPGPKKGPNLLKHRRSQKALGCWFFNIKVTTRVNSIHYKREATKTRCCVALDRHVKAVILQTKGVQTASACTEKYPFDLAGAVWRSARTRVHRRAV